MAGPVLLIEFFGAHPRKMDADQRSYWGARRTTTEYSYGERGAHYFSLAIHVAKDLAGHGFPPPTRLEPQYVSSARALANYYLVHRDVLDAFMVAKDASPLIGLYELTAAKRFADLPVLPDSNYEKHQAVLNSAWKEFAASLPFRCDVPAPIG